MSAKDLTLNIAVNLGRLSRFAQEGRQGRLELFIKDTEEYINQLENIPKSKQFQPTFNKFKEVFLRLKNDKNTNLDWAEEALTWANILTHRAKLS